MSKKIIIVRVEDPFECEGVFHEGKLIGSWSTNDAAWREYFDEFMEKLGIEVSYEDTPTMRKKLIKVLDQ